jgi:rhamnogalacturonyl hydrolase YesR
MGILQKNDKYFDEAGKQIINFNKYLFDKDLNRYSHGWISKTGKRTSVFWGRANGWILWAESEALKYIPKENKQYKNIEEIYVKHLNGIISCQDKDGMWHQILDDKNSFKETSCTAMFIIALSRGIISGLIEKENSENVFRAWSSLQDKINSKGIVKDICCGTGIGPDKEFYESRKRYNNDPRGLGAVITAAIEVDKLERYLEKAK